MREFELLIEAWRARYANRAEGGIRAIRGFRYQYLVGLQRAVAVWLKNPACEPLFSVEALSDIVIGTPGAHIEIAQAKRTGTNRSARHGLDELWTIHRLAAEVAPGVAVRLAYRLLVARTQIASASTIVNTFAPAGASAEELADFRSRARIEVTGDPFDPRPDG